MQFEMQLLWAAVIAYVLAGVIAIFGVLLGKRPERSVLGLLCLALALHGWSIGLRWERLGHGPYITMFEVLSSNVWSLACVFTFAYWRYRAVRPIALVVMPLLFIVLGWMLMKDTDAGHLPATYHTIWLFIHIGFAKLFSGTTLVAVGIAGALLLRGAGRGGARLARLPEDARLDELAYRFMALALIFETLMLITGAIWAQDAWGRYWAWDPLETWSFITWLTLAFALHLRYARKAAPRTGAIMILIVFVLMFFTFFGIPFISPIAHQGAI